MRSTSASTLRGSSVGANSEPLLCVRATRRSRVTLTDSGTALAGPGNRRLRWPLSSMLLSSCSSSRLSSVWSKLRSRSQRSSWPTKRMRTASAPPSISSRRMRMAALTSSFFSTARAPTALRSSGPSTCEWPIEPRTVAATGSHAPRSSPHMRSPSIPPHTCRRRCLSAAVSSTTVVMPASCRRASIEAPMPHRSRNARPCSACGRSACSITVRPSGLRISDAVFARKSFGAMPIEQRIAPPGAASATSCFTCAAIASATARCRWRPTSSHATSSMEPTRAMGMARSIAWISRWCQYT